MIVADSILLLLIMDFLFISLRLWLYVNLSGLNWSTVVNSRACQEVKRSRPFVASRPLFGAPVQQRHAQSGRLLKAKLIYRRSHLLLSDKRNSSMAILYVCDVILGQNALKMEMSVRVLTVAASEISSPFNRLHRSENPEEFWLCLIQCKPMDA